MRYFTEKELADYVAKRTQGAEVALATLRAARDLTEQLDALPATRANAEHLQKGRAQAESVAAAGWRLAEAWSTGAPTPIAAISSLLRDVLSMPGMNSLTTPDYAVEVARWLSGLPPDTGES